MGVISYHLPQCCIEYSIHNVWCDQPAFLFNTIMYTSVLPYINPRLFSTDRSSLPQSSFESLPTSQCHFLHLPKLELRKDPLSRVPRHASREQIITATKWALKKNSQKKVGVTHNSTDLGGEMSPGKPIYLRYIYGPFISGPLPITPFFRTIGGSERPPPPSWSPHNSESLHWKIVHSRIPQGMDLPLKKKNMPPPFDDIKTITKKSW